MHENEVRAAVRRVFDEVFENESFEFSDRLDRESLKAWDSLGHIRLIGALEETFGQRFTIDEIESFTSVARIVAGLTAREQA
jgi:acyl carrier protein